MTIPAIPRILLWGGQPHRRKTGSGFVPLVEASFPLMSFENYGRGGDTVLSLKKRLLAIPVPESDFKADLAVLWIGVNDVLADMLPGYGILKSVTGQPVTREADDFARIYSEVLEMLLQHSERIIAFSPLFIGEDRGTVLNRRISELCGRIHALANELRSVRYVNLHEKLLLDGIPPSAFVPVNPWARLANGLITLSDEEYDSAALRRGLRWTYDGVHLNSRGARKVAEVLVDLIKEELVWKNPLSARL